MLGVAVVDGRTGPFAYGSNTHVGPQASALGPMGYLVVCATLDFEVKCEGHIIFALIPTL